jgi:hypothetical protein
MPQEGNYTLEIPPILMLRKWGQSLYSSKLAPNNTTLKATTPRVSGAYNPNTLNDEEPYLVQKAGREKEGVLMVHSHLMLSQC